MKKLFVSLFVAISLNCFAEFTEKLAVKYERQYYGWTDYYIYDVTIMTGFELNTATQTFDYGMYNTYAVIDLGEGKRTTIRLSGYVSCGIYATPFCIASNYNLNGIDKNGVKWCICLNNYENCY
jgi:hypothetical protein